MSERPHCEVLALDMAELSVIGVVRYHIDEHRCGVAYLVGDEPEVFGVGVGRRVVKSGVEEQRVRALSGHDGVVALVLVELEVVADVGVSHREESAVVKCCLKKGVVSICCNAGVLDVLHAPGRNLVVREEVKIAGCQSKGGENQQYILFHICIRLKFDINSEREHAGNRIVVAEESLHADLRVHSGELGERVEVVS